MSKIIKLTGIREKAILCRIKEPRGMMVVLMREITEEQEKELDDNKHTIIDGVDISQDNVYCYGKINLNSEEDLKYINRFNLIDGENGGLVYSNWNYETGEVIYDISFKVYHTFKPVDWFKYNHLLIGKPERIVVYKCYKFEL